MKMQEKNSLVKDFLSIRKIPDSDFLRLYLKKRKDEKKK